MNRIDQLFQQKQKDVLAVYFTAGFPRLDDTAVILQSLQESGADLAEIGMPFSDPLADGPVIQESSRVALENGMTVALLFRQLENVRATVKMPLVLMGYLNPVLQFGMEKFLASCAACGIDGVILPDLPPEVYEKEFKMLFDNYGVHLVFLVTPQTPVARMKKVASLSKGFLYLVSSATTTGAKSNFGKEQEAALERVAQHELNIPVLTGFGIHDPASFHSASRHTNGAVVGSAFIRELSVADDPKIAAANLLNRLREPSYDHTTA